MRLSLTLPQWRGFKLPAFTVRPVLSVEMLALALCLFFVGVCNGEFWRSALAGRDAFSPHSWLFVAAVAIGLCALHLVFLLLLLNRWTAKPLSTVLLLATGMATYFMQRYQVHFDTSMMRNVFRTDPKEARDLLTWGLLPHLLCYVGLPLYLVWTTRLQRLPLARAALRRVGWIAAAALVAVGATLVAFQDLSALMRNQKSLRHLITPGNFIVAGVRVIAADQARPGGPKVPVGADARLGPSWRTRGKPAVLVFVVGETARAANWGLDGYARQTTPELAALGVYNFSDVTACGTNTEVSVPCLFSPFGRHDYDEARIHDHESLLHVLRHARLGVLWRDNQSGCKGVCSDIETEQLDGRQDPALCRDGNCLDEIMLEGLARRIRQTPGSLFVVLHQLGNHGPAYFKRYPAAQRAYAPTCETAELGSCSQAQIVNSYDNAIRYTDHFLAQAIRLLAAQDSHDAALIYVSDHGESLGENGVYLHGLPRAIAPAEQTRVPMVMWTSPGYARSFGLDADCMRRQTARPLSHDNLFHTVLGMLDISTGVYDRGYDLTADCRG